MRHGKRINHLGRTSAHRAAMLSNMASSLIMHKRINTTLAKAKELRKYIEPLVTKSKNDTTHSRRTVFSYLQNKRAVSELFREISAKISHRPGGYVRILKTGFRQGDNAEMCMIEFVDYNETYTADDSKKKVTKTRRSRKTAAKAMVESVETSTEKKEAVVAEVVPVEEETPVVVETPVAEATETSEN
jgi:large subunit ribosomal protein L17